MNPEGAGSGRVPKAGLTALLAGVVLVACSGPQVKPVAVPERVVAIGVASAREVSLAKRIAETRAIKGLMRLLEPDAVSFDYKACGDHSTVKVVVAPVEILPEGTAFIGKIKTSWLAKATAKRSHAALSAMRGLVAIEARGVARHPEPAVALMKAESRAYRAAIAAAAAAAGDAVHLTGTMTVLEAKENVSAEGAEVVLSTSVKLNKAESLAEGEQLATLDLALIEYRSLQEWAKAIEALERSLNLTKPDPARYAELGQLRLSADQPQEAADAFARAGQLEPDNPDHIQAELNAAKRIPDPERVTAATLRLREIMQKKRASEETKDENAAPAEKNIGVKPAKATPKKKQKKKPSKKPTTSKRSP